MHKSEKIRELLLDLISSCRPVTIERIATLSDAEWDQARRLAHQHRIGPLLHHQCGISGIDVFLPDAVRKAWNDAHRRATIRALQHQRALLRLDEMLEAVPYVALKGMWLAWHAYPAPALRPVRDIDLLVAPENAVRAFDVLTRNGFRQRSDLQLDPAHYVADRKHLPALVSDELDVVVEVHSRLMHGAIESEGRASFGTAKSVLMTSTTCGHDRASLPYPSATTTLLHLIIHSIYDHRCDNGPLVLADIAWTTRSARLDWQYFWAAAKEGGWDRGACLLFDLTERYHGDLPIEWGDRRRGSTPANILDETVMLMLQNIDQKSFVHNAHSVSTSPSLIGRLAAVAGLLRPSPEAIASAAGLSKLSERRWWHYPNWLVSRSMRTLKGLTRPEARRDAGRTKSLDTWLEAA